MSLNNTTPQEWSAPDGYQWCRDLQRYVPVEDLAWSPIRQEYVLMAVIEANEAYLRGLAPSGLVSEQPR